jgi:hypothetical protein
MCILGATVWAKDVAMVPKSPNHDPCSLMCILGGATVWAKDGAMVPKSPNQNPRSLMCILGQSVPTLWPGFILSTMCILGSTRWAKSVAKVPNDPDINKFASGTWKCNLFVSDIIYESGAK